MAVLHLHLTEDHLKLVRFIKLDDESEDDVIKIDKKVMLTVQTHLLDDVAMILGLRDKAIKRTESDADGAAYEDEAEEYMLSTYNYVSENLHLIESLLHQNVMEGIKPGHYKARDYEMIWERVDDEA